MATEIISLGLFATPDCSDNPLSFDIVFGSTGIFPGFSEDTQAFQSFLPNRSLTPREQLDFSTKIDDIDCGQFIESFWNVSTTCQTLYSPATCVRAWANPGLVTGVYGPAGWGSNNGTYVNFTQPRR